MDMITKESRERLQSEEVEYRVNKQAVEKKPATYSKEEIKKNESELHQEWYFMETLLIYEVKKWEALFWKQFNVSLDEIANDRGEEKGRLTREWRANCWKRLDAQMHAAQKRGTDANRDWLSELWASSITELFEGVENTESVVIRKILILLTEL